MPNERDDAGSSAFPRTPTRAADKASPERQRRLLDYVDTRVRAGLDRPHEVVEHVHSFGATMHELEEAEAIEDVAYGPVVRCWTNAVVSPYGRSRPVGA